MYLIVTNDKRIPREMQNFDKEVWTRDEFVQKAANSEEGLSIGDDDVLCLNIGVLDETLYEALRAYELDSDIQVEYYKFDNQDIELSYMKSPVNVYKYEDDKKKAKEEPAPVEEIEEEQVIVDEEPKVVEIPKPEPVVAPVVEQKEVQLNKKSGVEDFANLASLIKNVDDVSTTDNADADAKILAFYSAKGGSSKSTTALMTVYHYAKTHPTARVACLDLDVYDPQVSIIASMPHKSIAAYYKNYLAGETEFENLKKCAATKPSFAQNVDFYLPPSLPIEEINDNRDFWICLLKHLSEHYDFIVIDTMPEFYDNIVATTILNAVDKVIIPSNTSINSVKSVYKQLQIFAGDARVASFKPDKDLLNKCFVSIAKMNPKSTMVNATIKEWFTKYVPVCAEFGIIEDEIEQMHWYQNWDIIFDRPEVVKQLEQIEDFSFQD